jgi:hypothetical protein
MPLAIELFKVNYFSSKEVTCGSATYTWCPDSVNGHSSITNEDIQEFGGLFLDAMLSARS